MFSRALFPLTSESEALEIDLLEIYMSLSLNSNIPLNEFAEIILSAVQTAHTMEPPGLEGQ